MAVLRLRAGAARQPPGAVRRRARRGRRRRVRRHLAHGRRRAYHDVQRAPRLAAPGDRPAAAAQSRRAVDRHRGAADDARGAGLERAGPRAVSVLRLRGCRAPAQVLRRRWRGRPGHDHAGAQRRAHAARPRRRARAPRDMSAPRILAIESSCDETGVAVVVGGRRLEANQVATQVALHAATGGIVPEVAARQQLRWIVPTLDAAMEEAGADWRDIDAVAVTYGPGLIGSLLVGVNFAKALAAALDLPLVGVNHIEGHIYANWLSTHAEGDPLPPEPPFPLLC